MHWATDQEILRLLTLLILNDNNNNDGDKRTNIVFSFGR